MADATLREEALPGTAAPQRAARLRRRLGVRPGGRSRQVHWGKAMMWIFLLSDTFIFSLLPHLLHDHARVGDGALAQPERGIRAHHRRPVDPADPDRDHDLRADQLAAARWRLAVNFGYRRNRKATAALMFATALLGATFVGMQAFEWTKLIVEEGVRPWGNPMGAAAVRRLLLHDHRLPRPPRLGRRDHAADRRFEGAARPLRPHRATIRRSRSAGLYWHFVDLVWVFIFAFFYLW